MNSVFSFSELGSIFEDARADFSANIRAARRAGTGSPPPDQAEPGPHGSSGK